MEHNESRMNFFCIDITRPTLDDIGGILFAPLHFFYYLLCTMFAYEPICPWHCGYLSIGMCFLHEVGVWMILPTRTSESWASTCCGYQLAMIVQGYAWVYNYYNNFANTYASHFYPLASIERSAFLHLIRYTDHIGTLIHARYMQLWINIANDRWSAA